MGSQLFLKKSVRKTSQVVTEYFLTFQNPTCEEKEDTIVVLHKPVPDLEYLAKQPVGKGCIDTTGFWDWLAEDVLAYYLLNTHS